MKKIDIITFHSAHNYGAFLQVYALQKALGKENNVEIINYRNSNIDNTYKLINPENIKTMLKSIVKNLVYPKRNLTRYNKFEAAIKEKLKLTKRYSSEKELKQDFPKADVYITGSDQVWNTSITKGLQDSYTLNFGDMTTKRISYAASIGKSTLTEKEKEEFKEKLLRLDSISVREEKAKELLTPLVNKPIEVVLDPTLLIDKQDWEDEIKNSSKEKEEYILAYTVGADEEYYKIINELSEKTNLKVIHFETRNKNIKNVLKNAYTSDSFEFVNLIKNAKYVVCTSFHATVFSTIFNKDFFVIPHRQTGSRVTNLLKRLGLEERIYNDLEEFKNKGYNIKTDWEKVEDKIKEERQKSLNWLKNAICQ